MNKKKIVTLFAVLLALLGVLVLVMALPDADEKNGGFGGHPEGDNSKLGELIYSAPSSSINNITVSHNGSSYTLQKINDEWKCIEKNGVSISSSRITRLITYLSSLRYQGKLDTSSVTPSDCGITDASSCVTFTSELGKIGIYLGNDVANSKLCYLMTSLSDDIYMVEKESVSLMFATFDEYRNDSLERIDFENVVAISYRNGSTAFSLKKGEADKENADYYEWEITSPIALSARDEQVKALLIDPVTKMKIDAYVSDDGNFSDFGISRDKNYVTYTDASGRVQTVFFSSVTENKHYLAIDGSKTIYEVSPSFVPFANLDLIDVADRQLYLKKQANLDTVTIKSEDFNCKIVFANDGTITMDDKKIENAADKRNIFSYLCGLLADDISTRPLGKEKAKIAYRLKDGSEDVLVFSEYSERYCSVGKNGKPLYLIQKNKLDDLFDVLDEIKE